MKQVNVSLSDEFFEKIEIAAKQRSISNSEVVREYMSQLLSSTKNRLYRRLKEGTVTMFFGDNVYNDILFDYFECLITLDKEREIKKLEYIIQVYLPFFNNLDPSLISIALPSNMFDCKQWSDQCSMFVTPLPSIIEASRPGFHFLEYAKPGTTGYDNLVRSEYLESLICPDFRLTTSQFRSLEHTNLKPRGNRMPFLFLVSSSYQPLLDQISSNTMNAMKKFIASNSLSNV